jgi:hypothetical protein
VRRPSRIDALGGKLEHSTVLLSEEMPSRSCCKPVAIFEPVATGVEDAVLRDLKLSSESCALGASPREMMYP